MAEKRRRPDKRTRLVLPEDSWATDALKHGIVGSERSTVVPKAGDRGAPLILRVGNVAASYDTKNRLELAKQAMNGQDFAVTESDAVMLEVLSEMLVTSDAQGKLKWLAKKIRDLQAVAPVALELSKSALTDAQVAALPKEMKTFEEPAFLRDVSG